MNPYLLRSLLRSALRVAALASLAAMLPAISHTAVAQEPPPIPQAAPAAPAQIPAAAAPVRPAVQDSAPELSPDDAVLEATLAKQLIGKPLFLRDGFLANELHFDFSGYATAPSTRGSFTLCAIEIEKVHLTRRRLELEGRRFGLHFLGALPYEDPAKYLDRVNITPKKRIVRITIDREQAVKNREIKEPKEKASAHSTATKPASSDLTYPQKPEVSEGNQSSVSAPAATSAASPSTSPETPATQPGNSDEASTIRGTPAVSPAQTVADLKRALGNVLADGIDDRMVASMPEFWKLYFQAAAAKTDYRPQDPAVLRQNTVDKKAKLVSTFEPASNDLAQVKGVAGLALYHVVIGADGHPGEIAIGRPIGFGLDENAVDSIRKAKFEPAIKDGQPVPVLLDLIVQFRIYSKRTAVVSDHNTTGQPADPSLPGPYSLQSK